MDQRKLPEKSLIFDPPCGLLRLLKKVQKFSNLSNPEGRSEIRDFSGSFLSSTVWITESTEKKFSNLSNPNGGSEKTSREISDL